MAAMSRTCSTRRLTTSLPISKRTAATASNKTSRREACLAYGRGTPRGAPQNDSPDQAHHARAAEPRRLAHGLTCRAAHLHLPDVALPAGLRAVAHRPTPRLAEPDAIRRPLQF